MPGPARRLDQPPMVPSGLDALASPETQPPGPGHPAIGQLLAILQDYDLPPDFLARIYGGVGQHQQGIMDQRQAVGAQAFDTASQGLMGLATSGYGTPQGLEALTGAYQSMSPSLNRPKYSGQLEGLQGSLGALSETVPSATAPEQTAPVTLTPEDLSGIETDVQAMASGTTKQEGNDLPYGLHEAMMHVISKLRAAGYSEEAIRQAQAFVTQRWQEYGGPTTG